MTGKAGAGRARRAPAIARAVGLRCADRARGGRRPVRRLARRPGLRGDARGDGGRRSGGRSDHGGPGRLDPAVQRARRDVSRRRRSCCWAWRSRSASIHAPNESVDPSEFEHIALAEALCLERFAEARAGAPRRSPPPRPPPPWPDRPPPWPFLVSASSEVRCCCRGGCLVVPAGARHPQACWWHVTGCRVPAGADRRRRRAYRPAGLLLPAPRAADRSAARARSPCRDALRRVRAWCGHGAGLPRPCSSRGAGGPPAA